MMRSMFSGVSGLRTHQERMDVIGDNIANVNTVGFKGSTVNFAEMMSQTLQPSQAPTDARGGTNPQQIGLGVDVASIDTDVTQGSLESTGVSTDLAVDGDGYFAVNDGAQEFYTRAGNFDVDENGDLVSSTNGFKVQGWQADGDGNIPERTEPNIEDLSIPLDDEMEGDATTEASFSGNLDARASEADGTEDPSRTVTMDVYDSQGESHSVQFEFARTYTNDEISFEGSLGEDLDESESVDIEAVDARGETHVAEDGIEFERHEVDLSYDTEDIGDEVTDQALEEGVAYDVADLEGTTEVQTANEDHDVQAEYALQNEDEKYVAVSADGETWTQLTEAKATDDLDAAELAAYADDGEELSDFENIAEISNDNTVTSGEMTFDEVTWTDDGIDIQATANKGVWSAGISDDYDEDISFNDGNDKIYFRESEENGTELYEDLLENEIDDLYINWDQIDHEELEIPTDNFADLDFSGEEFDVSSQTDSDIQDNVWEVKNIEPEYEDIELDGEAIEENLYTHFNKDGGFRGLTFDHPQEYDKTDYDEGDYTSIADFEWSQTNVNEGADDLNVEMDFSGLTQAAADYNVEGSAEDGYEYGFFDSFEIDGTGIISGSYTNGLTRDLGQVALANFNNPAGLNKEGDNLLSRSQNSGEAQFGHAGAAGFGDIAPGTLEMSNVDMAEEFTDMIRTQRGFQGNSSTIDTSDEMLQELVNLAR
ncbi:flagellar hook-basal body complex protein [Halarsenatibacter silvermanii]|uniref:Flagellar hook protein FlgE n=1 Tax=Halarsenatibacter silvermanii TaxID=321763 RepID=A0A1G9MI91_9FIRM|nr:flagellar hook-basal body complex protein [Halarsenatibacter silvermanii]SDL73854.1 flagellar hook protein FlgE [Halarsenatibacter silvermanii]